MTNFSALPEFTESDRPEELTPDDWLQVLRFRCASLCLVFVHRLILTLRGYRDGAQTCFGARWEITTGN